MWSYNTASNRRNKMYDKSKVQCYYCKRYGHFSTKCFEEVGRCW